MVWAVLIVMMIPLLLPSNISPIGEVSAAERCEGDIIPAQWNKSIERFAKVPMINPWNQRWIDEGQEPIDEPSNDDEEPATYDGPEEEWMYQWDGGNELVRLTQDVQTTMLIGNDSVGILRINLHEDRRTTFCINIQAVEEGGYGAKRGDVYLMTSNQWDRYSWSYDSRHGYYDWDYEQNSERDASDVPPEWRSFDITGWRTYRDTHQYEDVEEVSFSVSLDGPEVHSGLFSEPTREYFYIVIDNTDNSHGDDAMNDGSVIIADVSIVSDARSTILPQWTVSICCMVMMVGTLAIPVVMNKRYMSAGLDVQPIAPNEDGLVPSLEQDSST